LNRNKFPDVTLVRSEADIKMKIYKEEYCVIHKIEIQSET